ncbi:kinase-like domain-containing protein [Lactarius psammicola]|nr:kinase-like domain-containing protein [Lactarius psammicola]
MIVSLQNQLLEGVWFLHEHGIAHLDLKPGNILVGYTDALSFLPRLSIIDFGISIRVEGEETLVKGYRGTPGWSAPEVGTEYGTPKEYSAIRADLWSCGQLLWHIGRSCLGDNTSTFVSIYNRLLSPEPRSRPLLGEFSTVSTA